MLAVLVWEELALPSKVLAKALGYKNKICEFRPPKAEGGNILILWLL